MTIVYFALLTSAILVLLGIVWFFSRKKRRTESVSENLEKEKRLKVAAELSHLLLEYKEDYLSYFLMLLGERQSLSREQLDALLSGRKEVFARPVLVLTKTFDYLRTDYLLVDESLREWLERAGIQAVNEDPREMVVEEIAKRAESEAHIIIDRLVKNESERKNQFKEKGIY